MTQRYSAYKDSGIEWIGEIPENWEIVPLFAVCQQSKLQNEKQSDVVLSLSYGRIVVRDVESNLGLLPETFDTYQFVNPGFIVLRLTDLQNDKRSLRVGYCRQEGLITSAYVVLVADEAKIYSEFLYRYLHAIDILKVFYTLGGGLRQTLRFDELKRVEIPFPPPVEQSQIVEFLDRKTSLIDRLIAVKEKRIELLKEQRTALINHAVTKGLDPNVKMKDSGIEWIGEIPEHWASYKLKHLVRTKITDGPHTTPAFIDDGIPFISVESIQDNKINFDQMRGYVSMEDHKFFSMKSKPQRNDILFVKSGSTTGKSAIVETDSEFSIWSPLCIVRSKPEIAHYKYLFWSFQTTFFRSAVETSWSYGTQPNIGMGVLENISVTLPPIHEQNQIATFLNEANQKVDSLVSLEQRKIDLLKEYRQALISEAVTGKIKVTKE